jgi:hypothetical protein
MTGTNTAVRAARRYLHALIARDWRALAELHAEDFHFDDRRRGLKATSDKQGLIARARATADVGVDAGDVSAVDVRGEGVALVKMSFVASDAGYVIETLCVIVLTAEGLLARVVQFDLDDLDAARAELDALVRNE